MSIRRLRPVGEPAPLPSLRRRKRDDPASITACECLQFTGWTAHEFASGTAAMAAAILSAIRRKGVRHPRVIIPAYACPDVVSAATFAGAQIDLSDTLPDSPWLDPTAVRAIVTPDTVAVVYLRFLGLAANDVALRSAVSGSNALLIEDSAHSFPQTERVESCADFVALSFGRGKPIPLRSGGALLRRNEGPVADVRPIIAPSPADSFLRRFVYWHQCAAYNVGIQPNIYWVLTELAGLRVDDISWRKLQLVSGLAPAARELLPAAVKRYRLQGIQRQELLASFLNDSPGPWLDLARSTRAKLGTGDSSSIRGEERLWRYPLLMPNESERDRIFRLLSDRGLGASRLYNDTLATLPMVRAFVQPSVTKNAADFSRRLIALPLHSAVRESDLKRIACVLSGYSGANLH